MTSVAMRLLRPRSHHVHSLGVFSKALPEFSDTSVQANNLVDEAFQSSLVEDIGDLKYWKEFRERVTGKTQNLTPRELARLKYALTHRGKEGVKYAKWGRAPLHKQLDTQCAAQVAHMNAHELLSSLYGFHATLHERIYLAAYQALLKEIKSVSDLDLLSVTPYIVSHSAIHTRYLDTSKSEKANRNFEMLKVIQDLCVPRITEMSDDQLATLCAGIGNSGVHPEKRIQIKELMDGIESDILNRRLDRMSGSNLADVGVGFTKMNWGSEQLFTGLQEYSKKKFTTMESDEVADLAFGLASRDDLDKNFQGQLDSVLLEKMGNVRPDFVNRLALYLFLTQSQNEKLIRAFITHVEQGPSIPLSKHYAFRQFRTFLEWKHSGLITEQLLKKIDENSISFMAESMVKANPRHGTETYKTMSSLLGQLGFLLVTPYVHENLGFVDFARMPERVAINLALPCYDLIGKYEPDERLVKDPIRVFKMTKASRMRAELFRMKGFKVLDWDMHHLADNLESSKQRNDFIVQSLATAGINPEVQKSSKS